VSDDPVTRILSAIERLRAEILTRIDRLGSVSSGHEDLMPEVVAHIQNVGDVEGQLGDWIGDRSSGRWIEGFRITLPKDIAFDELLYRVVLGRDQLSPWSPSGRFCGSEGLGLPVRGFCLSLRGQAAANYECSYAATFVDGSIIGLTPGGQICAAATFAPLEAFQIKLRPLAR
jgi:hypothetical protein